VGPAGVRYSLVITRGASFDDEPNDRTVDAQYLGQTLVGVGAVTPDESLAGLTHLYDLNGSFADAFGGPVMVVARGTLGATGYSFSFGQGPNVSNAVDAATYSIEMLFRIDDPSGYRRLLDFKNRTSDNGLYTLNGTLDFFPVTTSVGGVFTPGQLHRL